MRRLAIDIGARFADLCLVDGGSWSVAKRPLGGDPFEAVRDGLDHLGVAAGSLDEIRVASTAPLNALLAKRPAPTALLTTRGFADTLALARQDRVSLYDPVARSAAPTLLVGHDDIHEIGGRIDAAGGEAGPLDGADIEAAIVAMKRAGTRAVAICLLFAHVNPTHEQHVAKAVAAALPDVSISASHAVDPRPREYERTVATLLDAWMRATDMGGLAPLRDRLKDAGFAGRLLFGDARGVAMGEAAFHGMSANLVGAGAAAAARMAASASGGEGVALDVGSASADLTVFSGGAPVLTGRSRLGGIDWPHDHVDAQSLALGGSSRAHVAETAVRFVPGAEDRPTLDTALARLGRMTRPTGASTEAFSADLAQRIVAAAEAQLAEATVRFATRRNIDPTRADLVITGGAGPLLAAGIAEAIGRPQVLLPFAPAAAGALGLAFAPEDGAKKAANDAPRLGTCSFGTDAANGPALIPTRAGAIWVPEGWRLTGSQSSFLLERRRS